ncbi:MAG: hypothetical protein KDC48_08120 [Planctomycetes bacterium]|nr:hypothetical protein [Planctomycetota bacterium]
MLFCHPESEAKAARHRGLAKEKGVSGLPGIAFFDESGEVILQIPPSEHSLAQFAQYERRARQLLAWREAAQRGDPRAAAELLIAQLEERQLPREAAEKRREALRDESADERARLDALLLDLRIGEQLAAVHNDLEARRRLGEQFLKMLRGGTRPSPRVSRGLWFVIMEHCEATADVNGFVVGLDGLRGDVARTAGGAAWGTRMIADYEQKLARLRTATGGGR